MMKWMISVWFGLTIGFNFSLAQGGTQWVWIFFSDKGVDAYQQLGRLDDQLTENQREWRRRFKSGTLSDKYDIPLATEYIEAIQPYIDTIRVRSKLLNALSARVDEKNLKMLRAFPFIEKVVPVRYGYRRAEPLLPKTDPYLDDYRLQLDQINIFPLHEQGYHGEGMRIGILDTGFDLDHNAFQRMHVAGTYDFINGDTIVRNQSSQDSPGQDTHGTSCLSIMGGYLEEKLLGPAYEAEFLLAKTELQHSETPIEEDYYVAGLEWCAENGAVVISTSLGYIDWYTWEDLDGASTVTAQAVNLLAQERDVLVVVAMGNEGNSISHSLITPADARWVLAVGAVDKNGNIASFSSTGPTYDGRIKPDICARGSAVYHSLIGTSDQIVQGNGTSYATPLVAGACALIRQKNPSWTVSQIIHNIQHTGSQAHQPDNRYGYGILNADSASYISDIIQGNVKNSLQQPVSNATVVLYFLDRYISTSTNDLGYYFFETPAAADCILQCQKDGYLSESLTLTSENISWATYDFTLTPRVQGTVLSEYGMPVYQASIIARRGMDTLATAASIFNGSFLLPISPASLEFIVSLQGYQTWSYSASAADTTLNLSVELLSMDEGEPIVYPNPWQINSQKLFIQFYKEGGPYQIYMYTVDGQLIFLHNLPLLPPNFTLGYQTDNQPSTGPQYGTILYTVPQIVSGVYLLNIRSPRSSWTKKIVVR